MHIGKTRVGLSYQLRYQSLIETKRANWSYPQEFSLSYIPFYLEKHRWHELVSALTSQDVSCGLLYSNRLESFLSINGKKEKKKRKEKSFSSDIRVKITFFHSLIN